MAAGLLGEEPELDIQMLRLDRLSEPGRYLCGTIGQAPRPTAHEDLATPLCPLSSSSLHRALEIGA
jgi:hypothetical protein